MIALRRLHPTLCPLESPPEGQGPGWWLWDDLVMVRCDKGHDCHLGHDIAADGSVSPSMVCGVKGCAWHEFGRLLDWDRGALPKRDDDAALRQRRRQLGYD